MQAVGQNTQFPKWTWPWKWPRSFANYSNLMAVLYVLCVLWRASGDERCGGRLLPEDITEQFVNGEEIFRNRDKRRLIPRDFTYFNTPLEIFNVSWGRRRSETAALIKSDIWNMKSDRGPHTWYILIPLGRSVGPMRVRVMVPDGPL